MDLEMTKQTGSGLPWRAVLLLSAAWLFSSGCGEEAISAPPDGRRPGPAANSSPKQAQPRLPTTKLFVGTNEITAEIAATPIQVQTGMMWRTNLGEMEGMLFVFGRAQPVSFYMRNTLVPLTCAYIDPEGVILELHDMKPLDEKSIPSKSHQVQYVLEMNQGWFEKHGVKPGMHFATPHGTLRQTFFRQP